MQTYGAFSNSKNVFRWMSIASVRLATPRVYRTLPQLPYDGRDDSRRRRHRRWAQRPDNRGISGEGRAEGARARAPPCPRRRRRYRRGVQGLSLLRLLVRRLAAAPGNHPGTGPAEPRPRNPATRWHVHADAERRLSVAGQRPREDTARNRAPFAPRCGGLRRVRPRDGRNGAVRPSHPRHVAAGSDIARPTGPQAAPLSAATLSAPAARRSVQPDPVDDDERRRLSRPVVRDRRAQGNDVGIRDHRNLSWRAVARHGLRPAPSLHGRNRRGVPFVGTVAR